MNLEWIGGAPKPRSATLGSILCRSEFGCWLQKLLEDQNDQHGRNALLATYVQYQCTLPHPDPYLPSPSGDSPLLAANVYGTIGRASSAVPILVRLTAYHTSQGAPVLHPGSQWAPCICALLLLSTSAATKQSVEELSRSRMSHFQPHSYDGISWRWLAEAAPPGEIN